MVIKSREYEQGFCKLAICNERILSKVKIFLKKDQEVQESTRKISGFVKELFTLQNFSDSKVFGYKVPTLNSGFKISGDATKLERF